MEQNLENISNLLKSVSEIASTTSESTLFDMMGNGSREIVHSAIIGFLLNPKAHDGGEMCLKEFIRFIPQIALGGFSPDFNTNVELEKDLGPVSVNCPKPTGGDVDIFIEDKNGHALVIENKIYATDGDCQLLRYHNSLNDSGKPHTLIYLTLFRKTPSDKSLGRVLGKSKDIEPLNPKLVTNITYSEINEWLSKIKKYCNSTIVQNIEQYQSLINKLIMKEQLTNKILSSGESYKAAIKVAENLEDARMTLKREFIYNLRMKLTELLCRDERYSLVDYSNPRNSKLVGFTICSEPSGLRFDVVIDWRLYITCNRNFPEILHKDDGTWDYVGGRDEYNFHDCSKSVSDYLSSENSKHLVSACAAHQLVKILYEIEGHN